MMDFIANKLNKYYDACVRQVEGEPRGKRFRSITAARLLAGTLLLGGGAVGFAEACILKNTYVHHEMSAALTKAHLEEQDPAAVANAETVLVEFKRIQNPSSTELEVAREADKTIKRDAAYKEGYEQVREQVHEQPDPLPISIVASASALAAAASMIPFSFIFKDSDARKARS